MTTNQTDTESIDVQLTEELQHHNDSNDEQNTTEETDAPKANREAAKYRRQLRDVEAQRDALQGVVEAYQREAVEEAVRSKLAVPKLLWTEGRNLADLMDPEGRPDPDKLTEAVNQVIETYGPDVKPRGHYIPTEGRTATYRGNGNSFASAFKYRPDDR